MNDFDRICQRPGCSLPFDIMDRYVLESDQGPVEHLTMRCLDNHWYNMPVFLLAKDGKGWIFK